MVMTAAAKQRGMKMTNATASHYRHASEDTALLADYARYERRFTRQKQLDRLADEAVRAAGLNPNEIQWECEDERNDTIAEIVSMLKRDEDLDSRAVDAVRERLEEIL
jgi:hypothetical protein